MNPMPQPAPILRTRLSALPRRSRENALRALHVARRRRSTLRPISSRTLFLLVLGCVILTGIAVLWLDPAAAAADWPDWIFSLAHSLTDIGLSGWYLVPAAIALIGLNLTDWQGLSRRPFLQLHQWACIASYVLLSVGLSGILINAIKYTIGRARPYVGEGHLHFDPFPASASFASFPSGHSATLGAVTAILCLFFPRWRPVILPAGILLAGTRIIIGVHFPSDVIAGFSIGFAFAVAMALFYARLRCLFRQGAGGYPQLRRRRLLYSPR